MSPYDHPSSHYPYSHGSRSSRWAAWLSGLNLFAVLIAAGLLIYWSEDWWGSMVLVYLPKAPLAIPAGVLLLWTLMIRSKWFLANLASLALVLGPMMGLVAPLDRFSQHAPAPSPDDLRIVSCNIQGFQPFFPLVVSELQRYAPDLVVFQEVRGDDHPLLAKEFAGWNVVRQDYYWVGSKYPVRLIRSLDSATFERTAGLLVEVELPTGPIQVANLHLMTARRSLAELSLGGLFNGDDRALIETHQILRQQELQEIRAQIDDSRTANPQILLGDFNTPSSSSLFRLWWGDYQNAFESAGRGYGYTSPCGPHKHWPSNTPWVRIDHVLCSADWEVVDCRIGAEAGSDHRLIAATLRPREFSALPSAPGHADSAEDLLSTEPAGSTASDK